MIDSETYKPLEFGKESNNNILFDIKRLIKDGIIDEIVIEMVACYGMPVGETVFETCVAIGQFKEKALENAIVPKFVYRKDEKMNICHSMKAKDGNIIQALKDRFGDKGTKKNPGWFYGFKADIWQAYAVGVTYLDTRKGEER